MNVTSRTEIYTYLHALTLHDALPSSTIRRLDSRRRRTTLVSRRLSLPVKSRRDRCDASSARRPRQPLLRAPAGAAFAGQPDELRLLAAEARRTRDAGADRKSTRLNSSH